MQLACEGHRQIESVSPGMQFVQNHPTVLPEPVLRPATDADGVGTSIYGSVIYDAGSFRMWYQAWPRTWDGRVDSVYVGCVESDDGLSWHRPNYGLCEVCGSKDNHITDLPLHSPSVFIDPTAGSDARYRAFGYAAPKAVDRIKRRGYFTAYSSDGIHWNLESDEPTFEGKDVITSVWHSYAGHALVALKRRHWVRGIPRRSFWTAHWSAGEKTEPVRALVPDEFDDVVAISRGFNSADYYGVGLMPTPGVTVGFLWHFRHQLPLTAGKNQVGIFGRVDLSLVYQLEHRGKWLHFPGRAEWMCAADGPEWARHGHYTAASPIEVGNETWLYFTGTAHRHGAYLDNTWKRQPHATEMLRTKGLAMIGLARWPTNRLLGFHAPLIETIELLPIASRTEQEGKLVLNATAEHDGSIRAALVTDEAEAIEGYRFEDCDPIAGDETQKNVSWNGSTCLPTNRPIKALIELTRGTLWAFEFVQLS